MYPGLDPELGSSLEYEYSVTQLPPGDYRYVKWWDGGPILRAGQRQKEEIGTTWVVPKGDTLMLPAIPIVLVYPTFTSSSF